MNTFAAPWAFLLFLPWALAAWRLFRPRRSSSGAIPFAMLASIPRRTSLRQRLRTLPPALLLAGLAAAIVALARPQTRLRRVTARSDAVAIAMVFDVSYSMLNPDMAGDGIAPGGKTRLDAAKEAFRDFVGRRPADLVGLVTFGTWAETRVPLTLDHAALGHVLDSLAIREDEAAASTAIGDGLAMGCARLEQATNVASHVAVLLTDGHHNAGDVPPLRAAAAAKALGIRVYTIGIGDKEPVRTPFGIAGYRDAVDAKALGAIAEATGGRFFRARDAKALDQAMAEIDSLEKTPVDEAIWEDRSEHFAPWLAGACAASLLSAILGMALERRLA